jgi:hypothetical protein
MAGDISDGMTARWHDGMTARRHDGTMAQQHNGMTDGTMAQRHNGTTESDNGHLKIQLGLGIGTDMSSM